MVATIAAMNAIRGKKGIQRLPILYISALLN
jgi:hypothetical protein